MPSTYSSNLRLELIAAGEQANTWGNTTNTNLGTLLESSIAGRVELSSGWAANSITLTAFNGANDQSRQMCLVVPAITISANSTIVVPASAVTSTSGKLYTVINKSLSYSVTIKLPSSTGVTIPANTAKTVIYNGADFQEAFTALDLLTLTGTPTTSVHAVNKGYVDNKFFSLADNNTVTGNTSFTGTVSLPTATPTGNQATSYNYVNANYLWKASGVTSQTMNPFLRLNYTPTDPADAVHKAYVDANFVGISNVQTISGAKTFSGSVSLSGAATLTLANAPVSNMQASTKQYVDDTVNNALSAAGGLYALKTTTVYAGSGIQINGTSFGTLGNDLTISVVGGGTVTSVSATSPLAATGSTAVNISMPPATASQNGYLLSTDFTTFNNKCNANGSNASGGAWNISILGNAATASSVAWGSIPDRPTNLNQFTNGPGYLTSVSYEQVSGAPTKLGQFANDENFVDDGYVGGYVNQYAVLKTGTQTLTTGNPTTTVPGYLRISNPTFSSYSFESGIYWAPSLSTYFAYLGSYAATGTSSARPPLVFLQRWGSTTQPFMSAQPSGEILVNSLSSTNGTVYVNNGILTTTDPSDERLKKNIADISFGLHEILQLRPVSYNWDNTTADPDKTSYGFIAQEVQEVIPELVSVYEHREPFAEEGVERFGLNKEGIYAGLVAAIQELNAKVEVLTAEIAQLKGA